MNNHEGLKRQKSICDKYHHPLSYVGWRLFVCLDAFHQNRQLFSHVGTISCLPGLNQWQYQAEDLVSCSNLTLYH